MKVIFLDIDGVLNNLTFLKRKAEENKAWGTHDLDLLDPKAVELLNELVESTGANIVISSSWRLGHTLVLLQHLLRGAGFNYPERVIGTTSSQTHKDRGFEISLWLKQVPVDAFVVLDDDCDMTGVMKNLVQTDIEQGLTNNDIQKAKEILNVRKET